MTKEPKKCSKTIIDWEMKQKLKLKKKKKQVVTIMRTRSKQGTRVCNLSVPRLTMTLYEFLILIQIKQPFSVLLLKNR